MLQALPDITRRWRDAEITDAAYAGVYFLLWQMERHGPRFASRRHKGDPRPDARDWLTSIVESAGTLLERQLQHWFRHYQFLGIIPNVPSALYHWLVAAWPLRLLERIPAPLEVLEMQAAGSRPITVLSEFPRLFKPVLSKPDAFAFMVHDLEHAYKFMYAPALRDLQQQLFRTLLLRVREGRFDAYGDDRIFVEKFDYLISDMNTHPLHSLQYLQAILVEHHLHREGKGPNEQVSPQAWQRIAALLELAGFRESAYRT